MKTKLFNILILLAAIVALGSCTKNNGDIGPLFGQWKVQSIFINGEISPSYKGNLFFSFQSHVLSIRFVDEDIHSHEEVYASWHYSPDDPDYMIIDFSDYRFQPNPVSGFMPGENVVKVVSLDGSEMKLAFNGLNGFSYTIFLSKW